MSLCILMIHGLRTERPNLYLPYLIVSVSFWERKQEIKTLFKKWLPCLRLNAFLNKVSLIT